MKNRGDTFEKRKKEQAHNDYNNWWSLLNTFAVMFMQFRTIEETDITAIENMREAELRTAISEWKSKYEETAEQLEVNQKSINEYKQKLGKMKKHQNLLIMI